MIRVMAADTGMRRLAFLVAICTGLVLAWAENANAANFRGRVDAYNGFNGFFVPTGGIVVTLFAYNHVYGTWNMIGQTVTDNYGFYYFNNLHMGSYRVGTNLNYSYPVAVNNVNLHLTLDIPVLQLR